MPVLWMPMTITGRALSDEVRVDAVLVGVEGVPQHLVQRVELAARRALAEVDALEAVAPLRALPDLGEGLGVDVAHGEAAALQVAAHLHAAVLVQVGRQ